ncbi:MAG: DMT family transporter [Woeseiaceae bacterium]
MSNRLLYIVTVLIWGSTWIAIEYQLGVVAPVVSVFFRYATAAALLFGWCLATGISLRFDRAAHIRFVLLGLLLFCLNYILTYEAQQHITSALSAIVFSTMLWMNLINARIFFGTRSGAQVWFGSVAGIAGILLLFLPQVEDLNLADTTVLGALLCLLGAFIASLGNMVSQGAQNRGLPILQSNAWGMFYGAILTGGIAAVQGESFAMDWSASYLLSLSFLVIFGSIAAFGAYLTLLGRIGAHKAGYALVMFPVVALVISFFFEGLDPDWNIFLGIGLVLLGNIFVLRDGRTKEPLATPEELAPTTASSDDYGRLSLSTRT